MRNKLQPLAHRDVHLRRRPFKYRMPRSRRKRPDVHRDVARRSGCNHLVGKRSTTRSTIISPVRMTSVTIGADGSVSVETMPLIPVGMHEAVSAHRSRDDGAARGGSSTTTATKCRPVCTARVSASTLSRMSDARDPSDAKTCTRSTSNVRQFPPRPRRRTTRTAQDRVQPDTRLHSDHFPTTS